MQNILSPYPMDEDWNWKNIPGIINEMRRRRIVPSPPSGQGRFNREGLTMEGYGSDDGSRPGGQEKVALSLAVKFSGIGIDAVVDVLKVHPGKIRMIRSSLYP